MSLMKKVILEAYIDDSGELVASIREVRPESLADSVNQASAQPMTARTFVGFGDVDTAGPLRRRPVRDRLSQRIVDRLRNRVAEAGGDLQKFDEVVADLEANSKSDTPWLDWLKDGGFEALLKFIMELIGLFA